VAWIFFLDLFVTLLLFLPGCELEGFPYLEEIDGVDRRFVDLICSDLSGGEVCFILEYEETLPFETGLFRVVCTHPNKKSITKTRMKRKRNLTTLDS